MIFFFLKIKRMYRSLGEVTGQEPYNRNTGSLYDTVKHHTQQKESFRFYRRQDVTNTSGTPSQSITPLTDLNALQQKLSANVDCQVSWGDWTPCFVDSDNSSSTYNQYIQTRRANILQYPQNSGAQCPPLIQTQQCTSSDCKVSDWSSFSNCYKDTDSTSSTYNKYIQVQTRSILSPPTGLGKSCDSLINTQVCSPIDCQRVELSESDSPWSQCGKMPDGSYQQLRVKYKITSPPQNGGNCFTADQLMDSRACSAVNCTVGDWTTSTGCYLDDDSSSPTYNKYVQLQTRTILTPSQYGGSCNYPLTQTIPCSSINCTTSDWGYNGVTGAWSDCYLNPDGKWYHYHTRSILQSARYGGSDCGVLAEEQLCPSTDCQLISDWTDYGSCYTNPNDGLQYKLQTRNFADGINGGRLCTDSDYIRETRC
jgi:hypothetical protein